MRRDHLADLILAALILAIVAACWLAIMSAPTSA